MDSTALLTAIFQQILRNTLWASVLGMLLALGWRWLPGWSRYGLGLLVVCRLLMPALPPSPLSVENWWRTAADKESPGVGEAAAADASPRIPMVGSTASPMAATPMEAAAPTPSSLTSVLRKIEPMAFLWLAGATFLAIRLGLRQRAFNHWWKSRSAPASTVWQASLADCLAARPRSRFLMRPRCVRLCQIEGLSSPLACGIFTPRILVPAGLDAVLDASERAHVLQHELSHHRHHDLIWNLLLASARCLHWFNPLVHAGLPRLLHQREIQRDADVIRVCSPNEAAGYGATLLKLVTLLPRRPVPAPVGSAMLGIHHLKQRLTMIPKHTQTSGPAARLAVTAAATLLAVLTFTKAEEKTPAPEPPAPGEQKPAAPEMSEPAQPIVFKLNNITLPRIQFSDANIGEVLAYLRKLSMDHDPETAPGKKGIDLILKGESKTPITCDLRQVRLIDAIRTVCDLADYRYRIEPNAVVLTRQDLEDRSLMTRVFRINADVAEGLGWQPGKDTSIAQFLTSRHGIRFPEGASASLNLDTERLVVRLPPGELDALEAALSVAWNAKPVATFELTPEGLRRAGEETSKVLTDAEFTGFLAASFKRNPGTIIRLQCKPDIEHAKVSAALEKIRAAGLKNVDCQIRG